MRFWTSRSGQFGIMTAVAAIPLLLGAGLAVDYSRYLSAGKHLQEIADAAALSIAGGSEKNEEKLRQQASDFVYSQVSDARIDEVEIASLTLTDNQVDLKLKGKVHTAFMGIVHINTMDVAASTLAERAVTGSVEIALVLDNTESMNYDDKIGTLKTAAANLTKELFANKDADVRMSLVPYAEQINVGTSNRNASWLLVPDDYSKTETTTTDGYWYQPMKNTSECKTWKEAGSRQVEKDGVFITESWPRSCSAYVQVANGERTWVEPKTTTKTTKYQWYGCVGARVSGKNLVLNDDSPALRYPGYVETSHKCLTEIVPLTKSEKTIQDAIKGMITSRSGYVPNTYIPNGMMWGINVLSPGAPFTEGLGYDAANNAPRKAIVLMTDGLNTRRVNLTGTANTDYLKGGSLIGYTNSANAGQRKQTNDDTTTLCNYAKSKNIEIFTVAFKVDDAAAKTMLQGCATTAEHYFDATDSAALLAAFAGIAKSLTVVRLAR